MSTRRIDDFKNNNTTDCNSIVNAVNGPSSSLCSNAESFSSAASASITRKPSILVQMDQILSLLFCECILPITTYYFFYNYLLTNNEDEDENVSPSQRRRRRRRQYHQQNLENIINFIPNKILHFWKHTISNKLPSSSSTEKEERRVSCRPSSFSIATAAAAAAAVTTFGYYCASSFWIPQVGHPTSREGTVYYSTGFYNKSGFGFGGGWRWLFYYPFVLSLLSNDYYEYDDNDANEEEKDETSASEKKEEEKTQMESNKSVSQPTDAAVISSPDQQPQQHVNITTTTAKTTTMDRSESINTRSRSNSINATRSRSESISSSAAAAPPQPPPPPQRYLEMLVHNVAHTDLVLSLAPQSPLPPTPPPITTTPRKTNITEESSYEDKCLCKPRFSTFDMFTRRVLQMLQRRKQQSSSQKQPTLNDIIIHYPRYERNVFSPRFSIVAPSRNKNSGQLVLLPAGFDLSCLHSKKENENEEEEEEDLLKVNPRELPNLRVRGRDVAKLGKVCEDMMHSYLFNGVDDNDNENDDNDKKSDSGTTTASSSSDKKEESTKEKNDLYLNAIFFPLLATLLPRWTSQITSKFKSTTTPQHHLKKVVILVSGVGTPRNWTHSITGNSTQALSDLMEMFITVLYPDVTVVKIHSDTNIFRYDENISFVKRELMPKIDAYRDAHARNELYPDELPPTPTPTPAQKRKSHKKHPFNPDWKNSFAITLSFADGSPARTHAIQASLRPYKPTYFHFWQLKTFWHESKICDDDIEVHSFEDMETVPALEVCKISRDGSVYLVVEEMKKFRMHFLETLKDDDEGGGGGGGNDIRSFWLRKTKKPVLAVLLVEKQKNDGSGVSKPILYRGTNMEVSMPTGSLCAERNVIGTALASDPSLKREDLKMVAVLAVPLPPPPSSPPPPPQPPLSPFSVMDGGVGLQYCQPISGGGGAVGSSTEMGGLIGGGGGGGGGSIKAASAPASAVEAHSFLTEVEQKLEQQCRPEDMRRSMSVTSCASIAELAEEEEKEEEHKKEVLVPASSNGGGADLSSSWIVADSSPADKQQNKQDAAAASSSNIITVPRSSPKFSPSLTSVGSSSGLPPLSVVPSLNLSQVPSSHVAPPLLPAAAAVSTILSDGSPKPPGTPMRMIKLYTDDDAGSVAEDDYFTHYHNKNAVVVGKASHSGSSVVVVGGGRDDGTSGGADTAGIIKNKAGGGSVVGGGKPPITGTGRRKQKRTVVVHSSTEDLNPLRPCGACNEWLKKIAEVSIDFKVLTFTDADCNGVYVSSCQE